jgi:hypothetical protein
MLTAVWVAVVAAAAAFVIGVAVAIYVMLKAARLMTENSATMASLREREDLLIERASTAIDQVGDQIAMTETITASMDDVTASMAELRGRLNALAPAATPGTDGSRGALTWGAALVYGVTRALGLRWAQQYRFIRQGEQGAQKREQAAQKSVAPARPGRPAQVGERRRPALTGRRGGASS